MMSGGDQIFYRAGWKCQTKDTDEIETIQPSRLNQAARKNRPTMSRSSPRDSALFTAVRRCEPLSRPLVNQEPSARSLLMTHLSWLLDCEGRVALDSITCRNPSGSRTRSLVRRST